ncbi:hypothetical protein LIER_02091 [Lithospermum erythrorhizon]|uniref:Reverse transcriptase/retrotransposon-derived protein RNase H-like domain-containing protein n=1 Tax=Lithospermum erythrorhizon TaxID=34254 RepID=A0AAV3NN60_LITER
MPGVDPEISLHKLHLDFSYKPVKQKNRNFSEEKNLAIREEVEELMKDRAIRELQFPEWIANVVMVKKSNSKWKMYMDFTNLNKAYPKDYYPLPCLGRLDGSVGREVFDFLDASRGFISRSGDWNLPFFRKLRQASKDEFVWDEGCTKAFEELKDYLRSPKILTQSEANEELQLYLALTYGAVSSVLVGEEAKVQKPIYYVSHILHGPEKNYPRIDKFVMALVISARKDPQEDPEYISELPERPQWILHVDGASNPKGSGAGILIQGLRGDARQIRGDCSVKSESLQKYHAKATSVAAGFDYVVFELIPQYENERAYHLSLLATTYYEDIHLGVHIEHREKPIYEVVRVFPTRLGIEDWKRLIIKLLTTKELPEEKAEARKLQRRSYKFQIFQ